MATETNLRNTRCTWCGHPVGANAGGPGCARCSFRVKTTYPRAVADSRGPYRAAAQTASIPERVVVSWRQGGGWSLVGAVAAAAILLSMGIAAVVVPWWLDQYTATIVKDWWLFWSACCVCVVLAVIALVTAVPRRVSLLLDAARIQVRGRGLLNASVPFDAEDSLVLEPRSASRSFTVNLNTEAGGERTSVPLRFFISEADAQAAATAERVALGPGESISVERRNDAAAYALTVRDRNQATTTVIELASEPQARRLVAVVTHELSRIHGARSEG